MAETKTKKPALKTRIKNEIAKDIHVVENRAKKVGKVVNESPVKLYEHLVGDRFPHHHKMMYGVFIMVVGVTVAKFGHVHHSMIVVFFSDVLGYFIHGAGSIPFIEYLHYRLKNHLNKRDEDNKEG